MFSALAREINPAEAKERGYSMDRATVSPCDVCIQRLDLIDFHQLANGTVRLRFLFSLLAPPLLSELKR